MKDFVQIEILPSEHSGKILSARSIVIIRALNVAAPLLWIIGIGLAIWGSMEMRMAVVSLGFLLIIFASLISMRDLKNRWLRHIARCEIKRRSDKLVDPTAPAARFVEIVPKSNWNVKMPENATDVGFLAIDHQNKLILFEGDNERYRIPSKAIIKCEQDSYSRSTTIDEYGARYEIRFYFVVVTAKISEQSIVDVPFRIRTSKGLFTDKNQQTGNAEFLKEVERFRF